MTGTQGSTPTAPGRFYGLPWGQLILVLGPPKTGKSSFAGSVTDVVGAERTVLLCTKANEANSYRYRQAGLSDRAELFTDSGWDPELGGLQAGAWTQLQKRIAALKGDSSVDAVIIDSGTDAMVLASHEVLAGMKVGNATPHDTGDLKKPGAGDAPFLYYGKIKTAAQRFMGRLVELTMDAQAPKFVIMTWHTQSMSEQDAAREGITFEGKVLPMLEGGYREKLAGDCDMVLYADVRRVVEGTPPKPTTRHVVQIAPTTERHAAVRAMPMDASAQPWLPNEFAAVHRALLAVEKKV